MNPTRIPTLFAQIMGLVAASMVATALVGITAILVLPSGPDTFNLQDGVNALNAGKDSRTDSGRILSVSIRDLPPVSADSSDDSNSNLTDWVAAQVKRPDITNLTSEKVRIYNPRQGSFARTLLLKSAGFGNNGRGGPGGGNNGGGAQGGGGRGPAGPGGPGAPGGPPPAQGFGGPGAAPGAGPAGGPAPNGGRNGGPGGANGGFRGPNALAAEMVSALTPVVTTPEQKALLAGFKSRLDQFTPQRNRFMAFQQIGPIFRLGVQLDNGKWLVVQPKTTLNLYSFQMRSLLILLISMALVAPFAWLLARRLSKPIVAFASAAERLGRDPRSPPLELKGSAEVRAAVIAFNEMQEKLRRYVEDRTAMVAAIAHDLRTPLTRVRFRIDALPDDVRPKLEADIDQMDEMISSTLAFARDAAMPNQRAKLDLTTLVQTVFDQAEETGAPVSFKPNAGKHVVFEGDPLSLKRLFTNLVDNALKYGKTATGRMVVENGKAIIEIADEGPGIPEGELQKVFEPFYRRESSRNRDTGGTGLGLAVVRSIALAHGGDVILQNRPKGGLLARVILPL